jgi:hypothetical protein
VAFIGRNAAFDGFGDVVHAQAHMPVRGNALRRFHMGFHHQGQQMRWPVPAHGFRDKRVGGNQDLRHRYQANSKTVPRFTHSFGVSH